MKENLRRWWPALPACLILYFAGTSFVEKYPKAAEKKADRFARASGPDPILEIARNGQGHAGAKDSGAVSENPFRPVHAPHYDAQPQMPKAPPPQRRYVLKGTVGTDVATVTNNAGLKRIVKVGDLIDSAEVLSIETNRVTLKDRGGKFDLFLQK
jgi:hypothetical protein